MIVNLFGKQVVIMELKFNKTKPKVNFYNQNPYAYDYSASRKVIAEIPNDNGLIRYLLKIFREYELSSENGYLKFENRSGGEVYLHRVIMEYYAQFDTKLYTILTNPGYYEINHKNKKKWDNRLENLEFVTHRDNIKHSKGLDYEVVMSSQEIIQIQNKLKEDKQYQANKKYLEKVSAYGHKYFKKGNINCDKKFYDNLYIKFNNSHCHIIFKKSLKHTTNITTNTTLYNILMIYNKKIYIDRENTFFTPYNILHLTNNYNEYRYRCRINNNLQLIFKYYKNNKTFRTICNKYNLLNHTIIYQYKNKQIDFYTYTKKNIILYLFYYTLPKQPMIFNNNQISIITIIFILLLDVRNKYEALRVLYILHLLDRAEVKFNYSKSKFKPEFISYNHIPTGFFIPKYTDDLFTSTVLPLAKQLNQDKPSRITHTILSKNYGKDTAQRVYKNPKLKYKTEKDLLLINDILTILSSTTLLNEIQKYGFIPLSFIRVELQKINPQIEEKHQRFINSAVPSMVEIKNLLKSLKMEYTIINKKTIQKIKKYQEKNQLEETTYQVITYNQRLIVLKKLVVKNKKRQDSTFKNKNKKK